MDTPIVEQHGLRIAVEGCGHGTLHAIYASIQKSCELQSWDGVDLLIVGGDFQSVRNAHDLNTISMPAKYREIGDFHEYYSGARTAPYLTIFVGGNHEASNYLWELYYGGWVAPNIYYMGAANVVRLGPLRIAGLSGIWKGYNYKKPHHERLPYNSDDIKSIYHVRELDARKLLQIRTQTDIGISHDWPRGIEWKGDWRKLFRKKPDFEQESRDGTLGSVAAKLVLDRLRPAYWFSAHMHIKFSAVLDHQSQPSNGISLVETRATTTDEMTSASVIKNDQEIDLDMDDDELILSKSNPTVPSKNDAEIDLGEENIDAPGTTGSVQDGTAKEEPNGSNVSHDLRALLPESFTRPSANGSTERSKPETLPFPEDILNTRTRFLALDKCLPNRNFLQLLEVDSVSPRPFNKPLHLEYDKEWLAITRVFASDLTIGNTEAKVPFDKGDAYYRPLIEKEEEWVEENVVGEGKMMIPRDFYATALPYDPIMGQKVEGQPLEYTNLHTRAFCELLNIPNPFDASDEERLQRRQNGPRPESGRGRGNHGRGGGRGNGRGSSRGRGRGSHNANYSPMGRGRGRGSRY